MDLERKKYINSVNLNKDSDFPYLVLNVVNDTSFPRNPGFQVMHWHEDLQFIYVHKGTIEVRTLDSAVRMSAGEGLFINKNVVHYVRRIGCCHYNSFLFPSYFLEFYTGSPAKAVVDDIIHWEPLSLVHFSTSTEWHRDILSLLKQLAETENNKTEFYVYEILTHLSALWLILRKHVSLPAVKAESIPQLRIQMILHYIEEFYAEDISLEDLAKSANISKSECSRCFQLCLNTTPYKYLTEFRLSKAAKLLEQTSLPIGTIAADVGFHQVSHFGKCFKQKTGYSPKAYRKNGE